MKILRFEGRSWKRKRKKKRWIFTVTAMCWVYHQWLAFKMIYVYFFVVFSSSTLCGSNTKWNENSHRIDEEDAKQKFEWASVLMGIMWSILLISIRQRCARWSVFFVFFLLSSFHFVRHLRLSLNFLCFSTIEIEKKPTTTTTTKNKTNNDREMKTSFKWRQFLTVSSAIMVKIR